MNVHFALHSPVQALSVKSCPVAELREFHAKKPRTSVGRNRTRAEALASRRSIHMTTTSLAEYWPYHLRQFFGTIIEVNIQRNTMIFSGQLRVCILCLMFQCTVCSRKIAQIFYFKILRDLWSYGLNSYGSSWPTL